MESYEDSKKEKIPYLQASNKVLLALQESFKILIIWFYEPLNTGLKYVEEKQIVKIRIRSNLFLLKSPSKHSTIS